MKLENYYKPTPKKYRMLGDALLLISSSFSGYNFMNHNEEWGLFFLILGTIGKLLTNFANENEVLEQPKVEQKVEKVEKKKKVLPQ